MATDPIIILPEEIIFEIMTKLPVKSLCRFKCVSKFWLRTISDDPKFVTAHLASSKSRPKLLITVTSKGEPYRNNRIGEHAKRFYSIDYPDELADDDDSDVIHRLHATPHGSINNIPLFGNISVCSSSGLICCTCYPGIRIGNPITGDFDLIHHPSKDTASFVNYDASYVKSYLGFDSVDNRQVLLNLAIHGGNSPTKSSVFSLPERRQWHNTSDPPRPDQPFIDGYRSSICINGVIYTFAVWGDDHRCLYAFDVRTEHFEIIHLPTEPVYDSLIEYKGRPALVGCGYESKLWILEDPKKHSWNAKPFAIPWTEIDDDFHTSWTQRRILGIFGANRGELIIIGHTSLRQGSIALFLYAIETDTLRRFQVDGLVSTSLVKLRSSEEKVDVHFLIESLYSPKRRN